MFQSFKNLHKTFYSAPFYKELLLSWKGVGLGFIFALTLLQCAHIALLSYKPVNALLEEGGAFFDSLPDMEVSDGVIKAMGDMPVTLTLLKDYEGKPLRVLIDTSKDADEALALAQKMKEQNLIVIVNRNGLSYLSEETGQVETNTPAANDSQKFDHTRWQQIWEEIRGYLGLHGLLFLAVIIFIGQVILAFFGAVALFIVAPLFKCQTTFGGCMRLSSAAKFPVGVFALLLPPFLALLVLIWFGFAAFGLLASKRAVAAPG